MLIVPCPSGTYNSETGQDSVSDCIPTPAGKYSISASSSPTGLCNPGHYCPMSSSGPNEIPCPARYYNPDYGGQSVEDCSMCVAGGYCPMASVLPHVCPRGYYCGTGVSAPQPCAPGTYGNATGMILASDCITCDGGYYCDGYGLTAPRGLCSKGNSFPHIYILDQT